ncbi:hypothetical protein H4R33_005165 [Dimargaris cristalligena]|nr:hypothetical protein H4R33_005165 [Dimargaris cristalligena]
MKPYLVPITLLGLALACSVTGRPQPADLGEVSGHETQLGNNTSDYGNNSDDDDFDNFDDFDDSVAGNQKSTHQDNDDILDKDIQKQRENEQTLKFIKSWHDAPTAGGIVYLHRDLDDKLKLAIRVRRPTVEEILRKNEQMVAELPWLSPNVLNDQMDLLKTREQ